MPALHFVLQSSVASVSGPFSATKRRGSGELKAGQLGSVFVPLPLSVLPWQLICLFFSFYFHPSNLGGRKGLRRGRGKSEGWQTWKWAPFFPLLTLKKCGVTSCQGGGLCQEDTRAVEPSEAACVGYIQRLYIFIIYEQREKLWRLLWKQLFSSDFRSAEGPPCGRGAALVIIDDHQTVRGFWWYVGPPSLGSPATPHPGVQQISAL